MSRGRVCHLWLVEGGTSLNGPEGCWADVRAAPLALDGGMGLGGSWEYNA